MNTSIKISVYHKLYSTIRHVLFRFLSGVTQCLIVSLLECIQGLTINVLNRLVDQLEKRNFTNWSIKNCFKASRCPWDWQIALRDPSPLIGRGHQSSIGMKERLEKTNHVISILIRHEYSHVIYHSLSLRLSSLAVVSTWMSSMKVPFVDILQTNRKVYHELIIDCWENIYNWIREDGQY